MLTKINLFYKSYKTILLYIGGILIDWDFILTLLGTLFGLIRIFIDIYQSNEKKKIEGIIRGKIGLIMSGLIFLIVYYKMH